MFFRRTHTYFGRAVALLTVCAIVACAKTHPAATAEGEERVPGSGAPLRLALVRDADGVNAAPVAASALVGLQAAKAKLGAEIQVTEARGPADYAPDLTLFANQDFDATFAVGERMQHDLEAVAKNYPRRRFAIVDGIVDLANVTSVTFRNRDAAFLAGALAALASRAKYVAFLGAVDAPAMRASEAAFVAGAHEADPATRSTVRYAGSSNDSAAGQRAAAKLFDSGADVLYIAAGTHASSAFDEVRRREHVFAIVSEPSRAALASQNVLATVVKRLDVATFEVAQQAQSLKLKSGTLELGLSDGGIEFTDLTQSRLSGNARSRFAAIREALRSGRIVVPSTRVRSAAFKPAPI